MKAILGLFLTLTATAALADTASLSTLTETQVDSNTSPREYVCNVMVLGQNTNFRSMSETALTYRMQAINAHQAVANSFIKLKSDQSQKAKDIMSTFGIDGFDITCAK